MSDEEFIEPDQAPPDGMRRMPSMRPGVNGDKVFNYTKFNMPSIHSRNGTMPDSMGGDDTDPTPPHGIPRP